MAEAVGIAEERLAAIEQGAEVPPVPVPDAISAAADVDPRILQEMFAPDP